MQFKQIQQTGEPNCEPVQSNSNRFSEPENRIANRFNSIQFKQIQRTGKPRPGWTGANREVQQVRIGKAIRQFNFEPADPPRIYEKIFKKS